MSIFGIKRKNKEFAKWWDRWSARLQRNHARHRKTEEGAQVVNSSRLFFRNRLQLRSILEHGASANDAVILRTPADPLPEPMPMPPPEPLRIPVKEPEAEEPQIPDAPVREPDPPGPNQI